MRRYKFYKPSGVDWIGEIPNHWEIKKLKYFVKICNGSDYRDFVLEEGGYPVYGTGGEFSRCSKFQYDKISVLLGRKGSIDKPQIVNEPFWTSDTTYYTEIKENVSPHFFYHLVNQIQFDRFVYGSTIPSMTKSVYDNMLFPYPNYSEQLLIVQFLEEKTGIIDKLISTKQRKVELLKEQRTSLINHVITKGLNPHVKLKDSGVEWIGEIPEHWELKKIKYLRSKEKYSLVDGPFGSNLKTEHYIENGEVYVVESGFITSGEFKFVRDFKTISLEHFETIKRSECTEGNIIISKIGENYGMSGILPKLDKISVISGNSISLKLSKNSNRQFIHKVLIQHRINGTFKKEVQQTGQPFISLGVVDNLLIPTPSLHEQTLIIEFLDVQTREIDYLISTEQKKIDLLKEYRQSLISEVITGKIDVRQNQN
jgi:type I restriction enzyme S subunit